MLSASLNKTFIAVVFCQCVAETNEPPVRRHGVGDARRHGVLGADADDLRPLSDGHDSLPVRHADVSRRPRLVVALDGRNGDQLHQGGRRDERGRVHGGRPLPPHRAPAVGAGRGQSQGPDQLHALRLLQQRLHHPHRDVRVEAPALVLPLPRRGTVRPAGTPRPRPLPPALSVAAEDYLRLVEQLHKLWLFFVKYFGSFIWTYVKHFVQYPVAIC